MSNASGKELRVALAGNPNSGKTTIFNALTGTRQRVGNYPGVTVEHKEGSRRFGEWQLRVIDLPGTYSLTAHTPDELVARNLIVEERPDVVVDIVDASNLERNLYLTTQLLELEAPLIIVFNMSDTAEARGFRFDYDQFSRLLGIPVVATVGHKGRGVDELLRTIASRGVERPAGQRKVSYRRDIEKEIGALTELLDPEAGLAQHPSRWLAVKLIEGDEEVRERVQQHAEHAEAILARAEDGIRRLRDLYGDNPETVIAEARYGFVSGLCEETVKRTVEARHDLSDQIDQVVTNRVLGLPILLLLVWGVFQITFRLGEVPMRWIEAGTGKLAVLVESTIAAGLVRSLLVDGIIGGVGGVLLFLPNILLLFLCIAILEDSGYMARAAFVMDRIMHKIGLHGKSFIPLMLGFGCTVPAIMATRTLESRKDRLVTMFVAPLMSCGARMPIYVLLAGACFGPEVAGNVIFSVYLLGAVMAILMAKLFRGYLLPGPSSDFVMELPPYRVPTARSVLLHMWERGWLYLKKAGTIILAMSVVMWALSEFPPNASIERDYRERLAATDDPTEIQKLERQAAQAQLQQSYAGRLGRAFAVVLKPAGLDDWKIGTALIAGFGGKEIVVSTLGTVHSIGEADERSGALRKALRRDMTPLQAYCLMVFVLLYVPCVAVVAVIKRETNSWRWPAFVVGYTTVLAWLSATIIYQGGMLFGLR